MSRLFVRDTVEAELQQFLQAQIPPVPYYSTINRNQSPRDDIWVTCKFFADSVVNNCYEGKSRTEGGVIDINVYTRAGNGYTLAVQMANAIEDHMCPKDLGQGLEIINSMGVDEVTSGDASPVYGVSIMVEYSYNYTI